MGIVLLLAGMSTLGGATGVITLEGCTDGVVVDTVTRRGGVGAIKVFIIFWIIHIAWIFHIRLRMERPVPGSGQSLQGPRLRSVPNQRRKFWGWGSCVRKNLPYWRCVRRASREHIHGNSNNVPYMG